MSVAAATLQGMNNPADVTAHAAGTPLREVRDDSDGCFAVRTVTGTYLLDVAGRRLMRSAQTLIDGNASLRLTYNVDHTWLPLVELIGCQVGEKMRATVLIDDTAQPLRSSTVQAIHRTRPEDPGTSLHP